MMIYPVRDRLVRDPVTRLRVPDEGQEVQATDLYWARALEAGDVKTEPTAAARRAAEAAESKPAEKTPAKPDSTKKEA